MDIEIFKTTRGIHSEGFASSEALTKKNKNKITHKFSTYCRSHFLILTRGKGSRNKNKNKN